MSFSENNQKWLLLKMKELKVPFDERGVCFGLSEEAATSICANDFVTFQKRLEVIHKIPVEQIAKIVDKLNVDRLAIVAETKKSILESKILDNLDENDLLKDPKIQLKVKTLMRTLEELVAEKKLNAESLETVFNKRKREILSNAYLQQKINEEIENKFTDEEKLILDIPDFLQEISLFHDAPTWLVKQASQIEKRDQIASLFTPQSLEMKGGVKSSHALFGVYSLEELKKYFESLSDTVLQKATDPVAITLASPGHILTVFYNTKEQTWNFIDSHQLPAKINLNTSELAKIVMDSFPHSSTHIALMSRFYTPENQAELVDRYIGEWKSTDTWKDMHVITNEKAEAAGIVKADCGKAMGWLFKAIANNDMDLFKLLIGGKANSNQTFAGESLLHWTIGFRNNFIKVIIDCAGTDPNIHDKNGVTPLNAAIAIKDLSAVKTILTKADSNLANTNGDTPLILAVKANDVELVRVLLAAKADPNMNSPIYLAIVNNNIEVLKTLLAAHADPNAIVPIPFIRSTVLEIAEGMENNELFKYLQIANKCQNMRACEVNNDSLRSQAIEKCLQDCMKSSNSDEANEIFERFYKFDETMTKLSIATNTSRSPKLFKPINSAAEEDKSNFKHQVDEGFKLFIRGENVDVILKTLSPEADSTGTYQKHR